jgi:sugar/nucleoside kinase (ribokinase family)
MTKTWDVVVVGGTFSEFVFAGLSGWPNPGEEVFAPTMHREIGGAPITACGLARLGRKVALLTCIGSEDYDAFAKRLDSCGVDPSLVYRSTGTAVTVSLSTSQDRSFLTWPGANRDLPILLDREDVREKLMQSTHIHVAMMPDHLQAQSLFGQLREAGCSLSFDVGWDPAWLQDANTVQVLRQTDFFLPNEKEAETISGKSRPAGMLRWFAEAGLPCAVVKRGGCGSVMIHGGKFYEEPSIAVDVVDTTGAGDCFDAGFLHSMLAGDAPQDWLRLGNRCGALSTRALGGIDAFPTLQELEEIV